MISFYKGIASWQVRIICFKTISYRWYHFTREFPLDKSVLYALKLYLIDDVILQVEFPIQQDCRCLHPLPYNTNYDLHKLTSPHL